MGGGLLVRKRLSNVYDLSKALRLFYGAKIMARLLRFPFNNSPRGLCFQPGLSEGVRTSSLRIPIIHDFYASSVRPSVRPFPKPSAPPRFYFSPWGFYARLMMFHYSERALNKFQFCAAFPICSPPYFSYEPDCNRCATVLLLPAIRVRFFYAPSFTPLLSKWFPGRNVKSFTVQRRQLFLRFTYLDALFFFFFVCQGVEELLTRGCDTFSSPVPPPLKARFPTVFFV